MQKTPLAIRHGRILVPVRFVHLIYVRFRQTAEDCSNRVFGGAQALQSMALLQHFFMIIWDEAQTQGRPTIYSKKVLSKPRSKRNIPHFPSSKLTITCIGNEDQRALAAVLEEPTANLFCLQRSQKMRFIQDKKERGLFVIAHGLVEVVQHL